MGLERMKKLAELTGLGFMINDIVFVLEKIKEKQEVRKKLKEYYEKYPIISWLAQKKYFYNW